MEQRTKHNKNAMYDGGEQYNSQGQRRQNNNQANERMQNAYGGTQQNPLQDADFAPDDFEPVEEAPPQRKAVSAPRHKRILQESASLDEEEFQDYFTNPIKRKEFDRQRKKQQMREMQGISGFTLSSYGIKNMKALREAMPNYSDEEDNNAQNDSQKNYATVALCCLSVTNPFRNKIIQIVTVNPWFDRFILFVILVNCIVLAADKEVEFVTENVETIDFVFLIIYTFEMIFKIIAMGFVTREHSYLRDPWNKLDFVVVVMGWVSLMIKSGDISAIKVIRILRPLRTINQIPNMSSLVATILNSLPIMFEVMVLFFFMLIMFGTIATQLLGGSLEKRCMAFDPIDNKTTNTLGDDQIEVVCLFQVQCDKVNIEHNVNSTCQVFGNPIQNTYSFDNILLSILNIFQVITLEGWTDMMYLVREAQGTIAYDMFFVSCVILGSFVILNLMIAVQASYLDKAFAEEDARAQELVQKADRKKKQKEQQAAEDGYEDDEAEIDPDAEVSDEHSGDGHAKKRSKTDAGCCSIRTPAICQKFTTWLYEIISTNIFEKIVIGLILLNTAFLASEMYGQPDWLTKVQDIGNLFFTIIFAVEMIMKLLALGCRKYTEDGFNCFDMFIVIMSYVELAIPGEGSSLSVLRAFRLLRIFKIIKSWDSLRILLSTVLDSLTAITNLGVLIVLYLFICSLLTKQFFSDPLLDGDGEESRYSFESTGKAIISMFIILTGENWNEIMVQVIDQQNNVAGPALLFSFIFVIGNFMLLNLFLAILLNSITQFGSDDDDGGAKEGADGEKKEEGENGEEQPIEEDPDNPDAIKASEGIEANSQMVRGNPSLSISANNIQDGRSEMTGNRSKQEIELNDSNIVNSSNSNIEEEFAQIKAQLMALSKNMTNLMDKDGDAKSVKSGKTAEADPKADGSSEKKEEKKVDDQAYKKEASLFIFSYENPIRAFLRSMISNSYFAGFIYTLIAMNSLLLALDEPSLKDPYQQKTIKLLLTIISIIFVVECFIKVIVQGFYCGERTYLKDSWNILDFVIVMFTFLTWALEAFAGSDLAFVRGFRALRALRPLRVVSKNEGIKTVVNSLLQSIPALLNVLLIVLLFLLVFGILGIQLFKGKLGNCNDTSPEITQKTECIGNYTIQVRKNATMVTKSVKREWSVSINNYDNIYTSMMTFFEISTLEMWPGMMYEAIDSTDLDKTPKLNNNVMISGVFILYIFVTTFFIMNLFISVIVDKFNEEIKKRQGADNFSNEQKEWVKIQRVLLQTNPKIIPVEPINCFRMQCFKIVQSQAFEYFVMTAIVINTLFLCIDHYGMSKDLEATLVQANTVFVVFFTVEMLLKLTAYGFTYYWYVNWNKFDFIVVMFSLIALDEALLTQLNFNVTALRIIRVSRLLRMVKTSEGLRTLLKTLFMSMGNILNTAALLALILFTFAVAGMSLFGSVADGEFINEDVNFRSFYIAMMTLWRASTGESWNGIMHDCQNSEGVIAVAFWVAYQLMTFFIFMNVFIAVIGESFNDNQATEDENDILALKKKDIKNFQNTWAKYNPMGELYMKTDRLPNFLKDLPPPLGYLGIRIEDSKLNKIIFCLNIRDHEGRVYYPEVMWTIFHSIAGMNDEKVLGCEQIINILKEVRLKFKGLGKKVNLDALCGNKFYRKELTAIKYIQAKKILEKWHQFRQDRAKQRQKNGGVDVEKVKSGAQKPVERAKAYEEPEADNHGHGHGHGHENDQTVAVQDMDKLRNARQKGLQAQKEMRDQEDGADFDDVRNGRNQQRGRDQKRGGRQQQRGPSPGDMSDEMEEGPGTERNPRSGRRAVTRDGHR